MKSGGVCRTTLAVLQKKRQTWSSIKARSIGNIRSPPNFPPEPNIESSPKIRRASERLSRRQLKKIRVPPPRLIAEWLEKKGGHHILTMVHQSDRFKVPISDLLSIQGILFEYLREGHTENMNPTLERLGYTLNDLQNWSAILRSPTPDATAANRYLQSEEELPFFLLLLILRCGSISTNDVRALLVHTWYRLIGHPPEKIASILSQNHEDDPDLQEWHLHPWKVASVANSLAQSFCQIDENAFMVLISRFLSHARRTFPQAFPSIAHLFGSYLWFTIGTLEVNEFGPMNSVDNKTHQRLCKLYNQMIKKLSLPSKLNPAKNMRFAWEGQKTLLDLAGRYNPPLILDQDSYRGVIRALSGFRKSPTEQKLAAHMASSWPPWREEQDGVDAERPIEDDLSRPVLASRRMTETGYHLDSLDFEMQITGGREGDGTPTIASRQISTRRSGKVYGKQQLWVARIRSTRSVREAWMAFLEFDEREGPMTLALYHAVFEKLVYERLRLVRFQTSTALPGESKEVMQHAFQNFSEDELARTEPLEEELLYNHMIDSGLVPSGRFLDFLVRTAPSIDIGLKYLQDADLEKRALAVMLDCTSFEDSDLRILDKIPNSTMNAFVSLLCRFVYRHFSIGGGYLPSKEYGKFVPPNLDGIAKFKTPLHYAIQLVRLHRPLFRPVWYSLFKGLARRYVIIAASFSGDPRDDVLSWLISKQILTEFHSCDLELDPAGFLHICVCFEKAYLSSSISIDDLPSNMSTPISKNWKHEDFLTIKNEWSRMTQSTVNPFSLPDLLHNFHFVTIHAYIRVLGITKDWTEMVNVLEWMIAHKNDMDDAARDFNNGKSMRRKVFIAMKSFIEEAAAEQEENLEEEGLQDGPNEIEASKEAAQQNIAEGQQIPGDLFDVHESLRLLLEEEGLEKWGGWPDDLDTSRYRDKRTRFNRNIGEDQ